jgi:hypothetical protein
VDFISNARISLFMGQREYMTLIEYTTGFGAFAQSGDPLGEGPFPLVEAFAETSYDRFHCEWSTWSSLS